MEERKIGVPCEGLAEFCRRAAAEGAVLLRNEEQVLPLQKEDNVAIFGRCQIDYYRSGTGSGGAVNVAYTTNLLEGFRKSERVTVNEELAAVYQAWIKENPFDNGGGGWACEPWCQKEMPVSEELVKKAAVASNKALMVIGRTAGEDQDNAVAEGSYLLKQEELEILRQITTYFSKVILVFNVGNMIDMSFLEQKEFSGKIQAVIYAWQGGIEGGNAIADVLTGVVTPQGKLTDTIAKSMEDYPSTKNYGGERENKYQEDIYVGYRYFETFKKEAVLFPFGYGLSYTKFDIDVIHTYVQGEELIFECRVTNKGILYSGREVIQLYVEAPQGMLGRAARELVAFAKTKTLDCMESEILSLNVSMEKLSAFDDSGVTGYANSYVLEQGIYRFYVGNNVRAAKPVAFAGKEGYFVEQTRLVQALEEAGAPIHSFERLTTGERLEKGCYIERYEAVPTKTVDLRNQIAERLPQGLAFTGNKGLTLQMVATGECTMDDFIAQLTEEELAMIVRGEGMCSIKVTPGTASAFGGVSDRLLAYGIPVACCADGPSGIRMDSGLLATQLPIGTLLACTWDIPLVEELFTMQGKELVRNEVDTLLGPGINIHRHPLNGRNFEYFSEDPFLTGKMAAAVVRGIGNNGVHATIKHFSCNSQEKERSVVDSVISQRALREIYLKAFEMAVKEGNAQSIMTSYNPVNGHWMASNYELNTTILRKEWGYTGIVMSDWWAQMNDVVEGGDPSKQRTGDMVRSQNDLYMVVGNNGAELNTMEDDTLEALKQGRLTLGELQRSAKNICRFLMHAPAFKRFGKQVYQMPEFQAKCMEADKPLQDIGKDAKVMLDQQSKVCFHASQAGVYQVTAKMMSPESNIAQTVCKAYLNEIEMSTFQTNGTDGRWIYQMLLRVKLEEGDYALRLEFPKPGMHVEYMEFSKQ